MSISKISIAGVFAAASSIIITLSTNPKNVAVGVLVVPPLLMFIALSIAVYQALGVFAKFQASNMQLKRVTYSVFYAGIPVLMIILKSVDQLTIKDILLIFGLATLLGFYLNRFSLRPRAD